MERDELRQEMNNRFDRLEEKLDRYIIETTSSKQDINWIKGFIRTGSALLTGIITAIIGTIVHLFTIGK